MSTGEMLGILPEVVAGYIARNFSAPEIAAAYCCDPFLINRLIREEKLPKPRDPWLPRPEEPPAPIAHPILATAGRYALLHAYATDHGLTFRKALALWHFARLQTPERP